VVFQSVIGLLTIIAFALTIVSAIGRCPLWIPVLLLTIIHLLSFLPLGHS
jgi:hypothetical protein